MFLAVGPVQVIRELNGTNHVITEMRRMKYIRLLMIHFINSTLLI